MKKIIPIFIVVLLVVAAGAFYGGMKYGQSQRRSFNGEQFGSQIPSGNGFGKGTISGNRNGGGMLSGEIIAKDDQSITIKLPGGSSKMVFYSATMEIGKFTSGALTDLAVGENVMVNGETNNDGSVTAQSIQIRPAISPQP